MEWFLEGNTRFREGVFEPQRHLFQALVEGQKPEALWIGCSDSRVPANMVIDAGPGKLFVHRNVGNIVAPDGPNLAAFLEFAIHHLRVPDVVLCGHSRCGAMTALANEPPDADGATPIGRWLGHARAARDAVDARGQALDPEDRLEAIVVENVRLQLRNLMTFDCVSRAVARGQLHLHGLVYRLETGHLEVVETVKGRADKAAEAAGGAELRGTSAAP
jgi:carbonic anhydrase